MPKWNALAENADKSRADVDPETVGSIYDEATNGVPPKGPYLAVVKRIEGTESKGGDPMLKMVFEIAEPKGSPKAKYNGYSMWHYRVVNQQWAGAVNSFLNALFDGKPAAQKRKLIEAFHSGNVITDDDGMVTKIGTQILKDAIAIGVNTRLERSDEYGDRLVVAGYMPASDAPKAKAAPEPAADEDDEDVETSDEGDEAERAEELAGLGLAELRKIAKELGVTGKGKDGLIEAILDAEFGEESDEDEDDEDDEDETDEEAEEDDEEEPEGDEFDEMDRAALKKYIKDEGLEVKVTTKMDDDAVREAIRAALPDDEEEPEDDEEDEPEPPAKPARGRAKATAAPPSRAAAKRRKGSADDEPPF